MQKNSSTQCEKNEIAKSLLASHIMHFKIFVVVEDHGFLARGIPPFCPTLRIAPCYCNMQNSVYAESKILSDLYLLIQIHTIHGRQGLESTVLKMYHGHTPITHTIQIWTEPAVPALVVPLRKRFQERIFLWRRNLYKTTVVPRAERFCLGPAPSCERQVIAVPFSFTSLCSHG